MNIKMSEYKKNDAFIKDGKKINRTPCDIFLRVMGYIRPVRWYNLWKKSERASRKYFDEKKIGNSEFIRKYSEWQK